MIWIHTRSTITTVQKTTNRLTNRQLERKPMRQTVTMPPKHATVAGAVKRAPEDQALVLYLNTMDENIVPKLKIHRNTS